MDRAPTRRLRDVARPSQGPAVALFVMAGVLAAVAGVVFQRICAAHVSIDDIGAFNALLAVVGGVGLLGLGLQVVVARLPGVSRLPVSAVLLIAVTVGVLVAVAVPGPRWYAWDVGGMMAATTAATLCGVGPRSRLLRAASWKRLGIVYLAGASVRVATVVALLAVIGTRLLAAMAATAIAEAAMAAVSAMLAPADPSVRQPIAVGAARDLAGATVALGGLWALTIADTVLARLRLDAAVADSYALASTIGRASFFMALLLTHLALPTIMREHGRSTRTRDVFATATVAIAGITALVALVVVLAPGRVARLLLGPYAGVVDATTMRVLAVAWAAISVLPLLTFVHLHRHRSLALLPLVSAVIVVGSGLAVHTGNALALATASVAVVCALAMGLPALQRLAPVTRSVAWGPAPTRPPGIASDVTMIVPFFNPGGAALVDTVRRLAATLAGLAVSHRIIAVSDGSTDGSSAALRDAAIGCVEVLDLPTNLGKGAALRAGLERSHGALVGYIDADGDLPPEQLLRFLDIAAQTQADAVIGSKVHAASALTVQRRRSAMSLVFRIIVRVLFRLDVRDTQTGLKLYRGDVVGPLVPMLREDGFAIDVEILVAARRGRTLSIVEAPVEIVRRTTTTVSWRRAASTVVGLLRIFWRNHVAWLYDAPVAVTPVTPVPSVRS